MITPKESAVLVRLVFAAQFVLSKRFPSTKIHFRIAPTDELLVHVDVSKIEDYGDRSINPEPSMKDALTGFLESIGIVELRFATGKVFVSQGGSSQTSTASFRTHTRWLTINSGGFDSIITNLDLLLPLIPSGQPIPEVRVDFPPDVEELSGILALNK